MQAHTVLDSVAMVYTPLWNRERELAGVRVAVRATHPRGVDAPHLLQAIGDDWPEGAPPLVLSLQTPRLLQQALSCPPVRNTWLEVPAVLFNAPDTLTRLSLAQRLTGQVANGDLARANFSGDYTPKLLRTEKLDGHDHHVLELTAVDRGVTYSRVLLWVRTSNNAPHKAEFYSLSDKLLKTCIYDEYKTLGGKLRPTRLVMQDALKQGEQSTLEYASMQLRDIPDKVFDKEYLKKLQ